jgi:hypothetical protein
MPLLIWLRREEPETLTLEKLKKGFPMEWQKQRVLFGLAPPF